MEPGNNGSISFLDCSILRNNNTFETSVFRKITFSGLGTSSFSFRSFQFKINGIKTLILRGYQVCTTYFSMHFLFELLRHLLVSNCYPLGLVNCQTTKFLHNMPAPRLLTIPSDCYRILCVSLLFRCAIGKLRDELLVLLTKYYSGINFKLYLSITFVLVAVSITKISFLPQCAGLLFILFVVHYVHLNTSVPPCEFFARELGKVVSACLSTTNNVT